MGDILGIAYRTAGEPDAVLVDTYGTASNGVPWTARDTAPPFWRARFTCVGVQSSLKPPAVYRYDRSDFEKAVVLVADGTVPADGLISKVVPLIQALARFEAIRTDFADPAAVRAPGADLAGAKRPVGIFINAAGMIRRAPAGEHWRARRGRRWLRRGRRRCPSGRPGRADYIHGTVLPVRGWRGR